MYLIICLWMTIIPMWSRSITAIEGVCKLHFEVNFDVDMCVNIDVNMTIKKYIDMDTIFLWHECNYNNTIFEYLRFRSLLFNIPHPTSHILHLITSCSSFLCIWIVPFHLCRLRLSVVIWDNSMALSFMSQVLCDENTIMVT